MQLTNIFLISCVTTAGAMKASAEARRNRPIPAAAIEKLGEYMKNQPV